MNFPAELHLKLAADSEVAAKHVADRILGRVFESTQVDNQQQHYRHCQQCSDADQSVANYAHKQAITLSIVCRPHSLDRRLRMRKLAGKRFVAVLRECHFDLRECRGELLLFRECQRKVVACNQQLLVQCQ